MKLLVVNLKSNSCLFVLKLKDFKNLLSKLIMLASVLNWAIITHRFVNNPVAHLALSGRSRGVLPVRLCPVADGWLMTSATLILRITQFRLFTKHKTQNFLSFCDVIVVPERRRNDLDAETIKRFSDRDWYVLREFSVAYKLGANILPDLSEGCVIPRWNRLGKRN